MFDTDPGDLILTFTLDCRDVPRQGVSHCEALHKNCGAHFDNYLLYESSNRGLRDMFCNCLF